MAEVDRTLAYLHFVCGMLLARFPSDLESLARVGHIGRGEIWPVRAHGIVKNVQFCLDNAGVSGRRELGVAAGNGHRMTTSIRMGGRGVDLVRIERRASQPTRAD
jgi:hypothetical protein